MTDHHDTNHDFSGLTATFVDCTLKRSPEPSNTQGLVDASAAIMRKHGVEVHEIRFVDHDIPAAHGRRRRARLRQPAHGVERRHPLRLREPRVPMTGHR